MSQAIPTISISLNNQFIKNNGPYIINHLKHSKFSANIKIMTTKIALSSSYYVSTKLHVLPNLPPSRYSPRTSTISHFRISAKLGREEAEAKKGGKRKFITKEQEPEQYWQTAGEREGENPMATPLPYFFIFGMSTPFIILAVAFANGWIKTPN